MLVNKTKGIVLAEEVKVARGILSRGIGLMFRRSFHGALVFPNAGKTSFHGFFCFFPVLILCLDSKNHVREKKILRPWEVVEVDCKTVIELDARRDWNVDVGDELIWHED